MKNSRNKDHAKISESTVQNSSLCQIGHFLAVFCNNVFGEGLNGVIVSGRLANLIMISEEHWKNDEILFKNVYGHRESVV